VKEQPVHIIFNPFSSDSRAARHNNESNQQSLRHLMLQLQDDTNHHVYAVHSRSYILYKKLERRNAGYSHHCACSKQRRCYPSRSALSAQQTGIASRTRDRWV